MSRQIKRGFVHCAATAPKWRADWTAEQKVAEIRRWHTDRGWRDIGYHWIIDRDGRTLPGRPETMQGAHAKGHNEDSVAVCLIGGHGASADDTFGQHFTPAQAQALHLLIRRWRRDYPGITLHGHNEVSAKGCPGFQVGPWIAAEDGKRTPLPMTHPDPAKQPPGLLAGLVAALARIFGGRA